MKPSAIFSTVLFLAPAFAIAQAQSSGAAATQLQFDVASIKPNTSHAPGGRIEMPPNGRLTATDIPLRGLIVIAYNIRDYQLAGAPDWLGNDRYDIGAKAEGNFSQDQMHLMLHSLFAERLKLAVHREIREAQVYELTPAKGGLKLTATTEGSCVKLNRDHPPPPPTPGGSIPNYCSNMGMGRGQLSGWDVPMTRFASVLASLLGRPVIDKTGAAGNYNIHLEFAPDQAINGGPFGPPGSSGDAAPTPDSTSPNIFTALQEQLGIKAESAKAPIEMLAIDHVEKPSAN